MDIESGAKLKFMYSQIKNFIETFPDIDSQNTTFFFQGHPIVIYLMAGLYIDGVIPAYNMNLLLTTGLDSTSFVGNSNTTRKIASNLNKQIAIISQITDTDPMSELFDAAQDGLTVDSYISSNNTVISKIKNSTAIGGECLIINSEEGRNMIN